MGRRVYHNILINGVTYPNTAAVARAKGVQTETVRKALKKGTAHRIGLGYGGVEPMKIRIRGRTFPNADAAAKAHGVTRKAIYQALHRGTIDRVGLKSQGATANARPFRVGALTFPSMCAASLALGFETGEYISRVLRSGSKRGKQRILAAAMAYAERCGS